MTLTTILPLPLTAQTLLVSVPHTSLRVHAVPQVWAAQTCGTTNSFFGVCGGDCQQHLGCRILGRHPAQDAVRVWCWGTVGRYRAATVTGRPLSSGFFYPVVLPHVEYRLSLMAQDIGRKIEALADWVEQQLPEIMAARAVHKAQLNESG